MSDFSFVLTEKEWLKAIDGEEDFDDNPDDEDDRDKKKKSRKRKSRRDNNSDDSDGDLPLKRKRPADPKVKKQMHRVMVSVIQYTDAEGRTLSDPFMKLPSRQKLPDYYEIIKKPVDIKKIIQRIEDGRYSDFTDLEKDFVQLCQNAQIYNEEASLIYEDSINLQSVFFDAKQKTNLDDISDEEEPDDNSDDDSNSMKKLKIPKTSQSTASTSKKVTPLPPARRKRSAQQKKYAISDDDDDMD